MLEIALEITLCLVIAALIGFILGFIVAKATNKKIVKNQKINKPVTKPTEETKTDEEEIEIPTSDVTQNAVEALKKLDASTDTEGLQPEVLKAPKANQKDTLTQIKGIGPKIEEQLNAAGIYHFEQIANWSETNIQWLEKNTTFAHRAKKDLWINQAKSLI